MDSVCPGVLTAFSSQQEDADLPLLCSTGALCLSAAAGTQTQFKPVSKRYCPLGASPRGCTLGLLMVNWLLNLSLQ